MSIKKIEKVVNDKFVALKSPLIGEWSVYKKENNRVTFFGNYTTPNETPTHSEIETYLELPQNG